MESHMGVKERLYEQEEKQWDVQGLWQSEEERLMVVDRVQWQWIQHPIQNLIGLSMYEIDGSMCMELTEAEHMEFVGSNCGYRKINWGLYGTAIWGLCRINPHMAKSMALIPNGINNSSLLLRLMEFFCKYIEYWVINDWLIWSNDVTMSLMIMYLYTLIGQEVKGCLVVDLSLA